MKFPASGLYAITQTQEKQSDVIIEEVSEALKGGARVIQYRDKSSNDKVYLARQLLNLCKQHHVPLLINDDVILAYQIGADGVHIGKDDGELTAARKVLGTKAIIGQSCYDDIKLALQAEKLGADYVAFGRFFPSISKPLAAPAQIETLRLARAKIKVPVVAIGGILPENGGELLKAGANLLAVIGGVFSHDPQTSAQQYTKLFKKN